MPDDSSGSDGGMGVLDWAKLLLPTLGGVASGIANTQMSKDQLAQQAAQFAQTYGLAANTQAMNASSQLNRAPLADKGQYLALNEAAPTPFHPRDYTQGLGQIRGQAQGGAAAQLAANDQAAANYKAGDGGVDTDTLKLVLAKLGYNAQTPQPIKGAPIPPGSAPPSRFS
jgi:hypothetical protein